eukprot:gene46421-48450_t
MLTGAAAGVVVGVGSGALLHGNVGTSAQRFHTVLGAPQRIAEVLPGAAAAAAVRCVAVYVPDTPPRLCATALDAVYDLMACNTQESAHRATSVGAADAYRILYERALREGCTHSLEQISRLAEADPVLGHVAGQLRVHQIRHPTGAAARAAAPVAGVVELEREEYGGKT